MSDFTKATVMNVATTSSPTAPNTTLIVDGPCRLFAIYVNTALSAHSIAIQNWASASPQPAAVTLFTIPASAGAGTMYTFPGAEFKGGLRVLPNIASTGSITLMWKPGTAASLGA